MMTRIFAQIAVALAMLLAGVWQAAAGSSPAYVSERVTARLIAAENGVAPEAGSISAALQIELAEGWHSYWKSPGAVGYPPELDWSDAKNVAATEFGWPVPQRFSAFDIENYGYKGAVTHPIRVTLQEPGKTALLSTHVNMLVCAEICVPEEFSLTLVIPPGTAIDRDAASLIAQASAASPTDNAGDAFSLERALISPDGKTLSVALTSQASLTGLRAFPDLGATAAFGPPELAIAANGTEATVSFEVLSAPDPLPPLALTVASDAQTALLTAPLEIGAASPPAKGPSLAWVFLLALIGGLILNVMPCVLPVLTLKLASALKARDQSPARVRAGFLASAAGVLAFMWALALALLAIRASGGAVGWGIQFQSPLFLSLMAAIVTAFAANMLGLFEINLSQNANTRLAGIGSQGGLDGDFATGALAAVLATPCSAPFLGTAITVALAGSAPGALIIFTGLGLGLALPYLMIAAFPASIRALPKPGRWMETIRKLMGALLGLTAIWLLWVLAGVIGLGPMLGVAVLFVLATGALSWLSGTRRLAAPALAIGAIVLASTVTLPTQSPATEQDAMWQSFSMQTISEGVAAGDTVFVDITADWCLTCKVNKKLVLDQDPVAQALTALTALRGDWTRPDDTILAYLKEHDRFGIPFNIVYGPGAPDGIALPELLTSEAVLDAITQAQGG